MPDSFDKDMTVKALACLPFGRQDDMLGARGPWAKIAGLDFQLPGC